MSPCSGLIGLLGGGSATTSGYGGWWVVGSRAQEGPRSPLSPSLGLISVLRGGGCRGVDGGRYGGGRLQETPVCLIANCSGLICVRDSAV